MVKREIIKDILPWLGEKKLIIIKGARQVGKTTILFQIKDILESEDNQVIYFSADQEITNPIFKEPKLLIKFLENEYDIKNKKSYLFLDEVQYIRSTGLFLKVLFDITNSYLNIVVSGSSLLKLSEDKEFLTGRKIEFNLSSFSLFEHLRAKSSYKYDFSWDINDRLDIIDDFYKIYKDDLQLNFVDYINWGGYPEVVLHSEIVKKKRILKEIINTYIQKDVINFLKIENIDGFNNLAAVLSSQIGNLVNKHELSNTLNLHTATLEKYLNILEGTFIYSLLKPYHTNTRKELTKMRKVYVNDLGIRKYFTGVEYENYAFIDGNSIENFIYNELKKNVEYENIYFYRTISKSEIDFVIKRKANLILFESKFRNVVKMPQSITRFMRKYENVEKVMIITKDLLMKEGQTLYFPVVLLPFITF